MADDPTLQFPLRGTSECPTCGHTTQPGDIECNLCGTTLPRDLPPLTPPPSPLAPTAVAPPPAEPADPTVVAPLPPRPPRIKEKTAKATSPSPPPPTPPPVPLREAPGEEITVKVTPPLSPPPAPRPTPVQEVPRNAVRPVPPPPRLIPVSPALEPSPGLRTGQPSASLPSTRPQSSAFTKWGSLAAGALALFFVSFFAAKMFSPAGVEKETATPLPGTGVERSDEKTVGSTTVEKKAEPSPSLPPVTPPPVTLPPQPVGRVTTAEHLLPIRIFGADPNDELRGNAAFRTQVEQGLPGIREAYTAQIVGNPQSLGAVILEFSVTPDGQVVSAAAHTTGSVSRDLQQTIVNAAKRWQFPRIQGAEVKCFYPLLLSPEKIDAATFASHFNAVWPGRYKVLAAAPVPVRSQASDSAEQVGTFGAGLFLSVVSSQDGWLGALSPKGKVGYVRQDAIVPRVENTAGADAKG